MIYFTSDFHLGYPKVIKHRKRPFTSVEEMNETLIANYNSMVTDKDTVYLLGDMTQYVEPEAANVMLARLNGKKILLVGNHDKVNKYDARIFKEICDYKFLVHKRALMALMHYPMLAWNRYQRGSYMLHGHIHSTGEYNESNRAEGIRRYDVGVDANNFYPVSLDKILKFFEAK
ncbi:MAG: metallophosphoesterase [Veillonella sp.]|uniref:metallophosphoesterase n=1 Tax=Veillonella sp. TaxID=1926307 RepID=UPI0026009960|nr:metallophosphoesterase [Veillonella sp.]MBS4914262.1 metallophosphoesterase [Veillonella sp.]